MAPYPARALRPALVDQSTLVNVGAVANAVMNTDRQKAKPMPKSDQFHSGVATSSQAARDAFWQAAQLGTGLIELDLQECLDLLAAKAVGRIAYTTGAGARILPVNYVLVDDCIIFRTVSDGEIFRHAMNSVCAFEIDETDEFFQSGWSVVAIGRLEPATEDDFARMRFGELPEPWAGGNRSLFVRLPCEQVSGRRVIGGAR